MNIEEKIIRYVETHSDRRGRVRVRLEDLVLGLRDDWPEDGRPTVGETHEALLELKRQRRLEYNVYFGELQMRLPAGARMEAEARSK